MIRRLTCLLGIHKDWTMVAPLKVLMPDDSISISWAGLECVHCGAKRYSNQLKPGESLHINMLEMASDVGWYEE